MATTVTVMPETSGRVESQEGKPAVTGDQADPHRTGSCDYSSTPTGSYLRVGRRRMTPRLELRMKSTKYVNFRHVETRVRIDDGTSACVVFSFDCRR